MFHVLEALKEDTKEQCKCMLNTTELGQLATEYLDDRRNEFRALEIAIKTDMALRRLSLQEVENEVERIEGNLSKMLRRDVSYLKLRIDEAALYIFLYRVT